jgi:hypothetical protein
MTDLGQKQIAVKLSDKYISRLDDLVRRGGMNRSQLMVHFIRVWLQELIGTPATGFFHLAIILREKKADLWGDHRRQSEFVELFNPSPERPLPIKLNEDDVMHITAFAGMSNITRHNMMKAMITTGIEEMEILTEGKKYEFSAIEPKLKREFGIILARGFKAFTEGIKEKKPLKRRE